ncbi:hypothetical protein F5141DRAFT_1067851 [Pisolithus sp. B1]|nr:hypothetical protein F5141DRAFT_1067851 [Pisolithus sp. B1]
MFSEEKLSNACSASVHEETGFCDDPVEANPGPTTAKFPSEPPLGLESDVPPFSGDEGTGHPLQTDDDVHHLIKVSQDPPTTKRSRGCPAGSKKKGGEKQTQRGPEFVTTRVMRSQKHNSSSELQYDKVVVTVSPRKNPMVASGHSQHLDKVSPTISRPVAGPSSCITPTIENSSSSSSSDEATKDEFIKLCSTLKDVKKTHGPQLSNIFSQIKANKHAYVYISVLCWPPILTNYL